jgi:hypothetical protein
MLAHSGEYLLLLVDDSVEAVLSEDGLLRHILESRLSLIVLLLLQFALAYLSILIFGLLVVLGNVLLGQPERRRPGTMRTHMRHTRHIWPSVLVAKEWFLSITQDAHGTHARG